MAHRVGNNVKLGMPLIILLFIFSSFITSRKAVPVFYLSINLVKIELLYDGSITTVSREISLASQAEVGTAETLPNTTYSWGVKINVEGRILLLLIVHFCLRICIYYVSSPRMPLNNKTLRWEIRVIKRRLSQSYKWLWWKDQKTLRIACGSLSQPQSLARFHQVCRVLVSYLQPQRYISYDDAIPPFPLPPQTKKRREKKRKKNDKSPLFSSL